MVNYNVVLNIYAEIKDNLFHIFNNSINTGIFPDNLKIAKVIPIFKSGDESLLTNYRPISVLPAFSKVLERIMYNRIYNYTLPNINLFTINNLDSKKIQLQNMPFFN